MDTNAITLVCEPIASIFTIVIGLFSALATYAEPLFGLLTVIAPNPSTYAGDVCVFVLSTLFGVAQPTQ